MSDAFNGNHNSHIYGIPNRIGHEDRHIQNVIDHANDLFPGRDADVPSIPCSAGVQESPEHQVGFLGGYQLNDDEHLDDFDRQVLGRPLASNHSNSSDIGSPRVSLPHSSSSSGHRRQILGDASHHFRPFTSRGENWQSPFASNHLNFNQFQPSPATQPMFERDNSHRVSELQRGNQIGTPPLYTAANHHIQHPRTSIQSSSPSELGGSSPSAYLSLRNKQPHVSSKPRAAQNHPTTFRPDLDHAPKTQSPTINGVNLLNPRRELPDKCRAVFPYELFNAVQSRCFPHVYGTDDNVVISAPTGSGKTAILELAICKLFNQPGGEDFKIVYQAPTKSLCSERAKDWEKKFSHMNLKCVELTGDTSQQETRRVGSASIIVTTPEKWDSITRKWSDHDKLLKMIRLVLIDEVHMLKDVRGATLEAVVSRMKTIGAEVRFIALSATVPNIEDVAIWLGRNHTNQKQPAVVEKFSEELRPVKLKRFVYGYDSMYNEYMFENSLDGKLQYLLNKHTEGKPTMVFCFTRKSCEQTAQKLADWWCHSKQQDRAWPAPTQRIPVISKNLVEIVRYGVAFHHAGLDSEDRAAVEDNFLRGQLHVICCTSTLAVGVNLPCHTVVLKGTMAHTDDGLQEYSDLEVMQMLGRAGRPQFDRSATAIIMTKKENSDRYDKMISGQELLESTLHLNLIEHLNSEIGLGTIQNLAMAKKWISGTFLNVRMHQAPSHYGQGQAHLGATADERIQEWCERDIGLLQEHGLITDGDKFSCTEYGKAMSRYMIQFETMKLLLSIPRAPSMDKMLIELSRATEFKEFRPKPIEKALCKTMNGELLYPLKENVSETWHKVFIMVQLHLGQVILPEDKNFASIKRQISLEKHLIFDRLNRLVRCVVDCKVYDHDAIGARAGLELARAIAAESWEGKSTQIQQIPNIGPVGMRKFISSGVRTVAGVAGLGYDEIERIMVRNPPYGRNLLKQLEGFPRLSLSAEITNPRGTCNKTENGIRVKLKVTLGYTNANLPAWRGKTPAVNLTVGTSDGNLACYWRGSIKTIDRVSGRDMDVIVPLNRPDETISCCFSCEEIVGTLVTQELKPIIPASLFFQPGGREIRAPQQKARSPVPHDTNDLDDEDLADQDMLEILNSANNSVPTRHHLDMPGPSESNNEFPEIEDILEEEPLAPEQMANGKWMCNHFCRGGGPTKTGKRCNHKCCHEGLDKPRPISKKKRVADEAYGDSVLGSQSGRSQGPVPKRNKTSHPAAQSTNSSTSKNLKSLKSSEQDFKEDYPFPSKPSLQSTDLKRPNSLSGPISKPKDPLKRSTSHGDGLDHDMTGQIECIDLSALTDDDSEHSEICSANMHSSFAKGKQELLDLHTRIQGGEETQRLTKPYKPIDSKAEKSRGYSFSAHHDSSGRKDLDGGESDYGSDVFDAENYLPEITDIGKNRGHAKGDNSSLTITNDETLYPGVARTLAESKDYG